MCSSRRACVHTHTAEPGRAVRRYVGFAAAETVFVTLCCHGFNWMFHNRYCGFLFNCGCTWEWDGGWAYCNVHNPTGPRCPWCAAGNPPTPGFNSTGAQTLSQWVFSINQYLVTFLMILSWAVAFYLQTRRGRALRHNLYFQRSLCVSDSRGACGATSRNRKCDISGNVYESAPAQQPRDLKAVSVGEETEMSLREVADPHDDARRGSGRIDRQDQRLPLSEGSEGEDRKRKRTRALLFVLRAFFCPLCNFWGVRLLGCTRVLRSFRLSVLYVVQCNSKEVRRN
eukprot:INCI14163.2.p1 GENE.INCI14163.2~~INCI14163.2.p1  ORF type:complete len:284 (-),score=22.02 INCI14163.2:88-939(-)